LANTTIKLVNNRSIIPSINNTDDQNHALEIIVNFTYNTKDNIIVLEGAAGTGKTHLTREIYKYRHKVGSMIVSAPTHTAVAKIAKRTGINGKTIQHLCGFRPNYNLENFDINNIPFARSRRAQQYILNHKIIAIDEASMINKGLKGYINNIAIENNLKIIYIGDPYQLPPVGEDKSSVFDLSNKVIIKQIVRQASDSKLLPLLVRARRAIDNIDNSLIEYLIKNPTNIDKESGYHTLFSKYTEQTTIFRDAMLKYFSHPKFTNDINFCRYLAYTNDNISSWNRYIRGYLITSSSTNILHKDDLLLSYNTMVDEFNNPLLINSEDYIIYHDSEGKANITEFILAPYNIEGYITKLQSVTTGDVTNKNIFIVNHSDVNNIKRFKQVFYTALRTAKASGNWKQDYYETFKDEHLLIKALYDDRGKLLLKRDLDYGFGLTIHKSQGSTYDNVFVNLRDVLFDKYGFQYKNINLRNRLIYVALSRASKKAIILL